MRFSLVLLSTVCLAACTQKAEQASVYDKGGYFYGQDGIQNASYVSHETISNRYRPDPYSPDFRAKNGKVNLDGYETAQAETYAPAPVTSVQTVSLAPISSQDLSAPTAKAEAAPVEFKRYSAKNVGKYTFIEPVQGDVVVGYGKRPNGVVNEGINYLLPAGEPVFASAGGKVVYVGEGLKGYGKMVIIKHDNGYNSSYAHLGRTDTLKDAAVKQGDIIGYTGQTGNVDRPQLHFAIRKGADPIDPNSLLMKQMASR